MSFAPGDRVHLASIGTGRIIEVRGRDRYAVELKGRVVVAAARDLELADDTPAKRPAVVRDETKPDEAPLRRLSSRAAIDLHGRTVHEAVEMVETFINDALLEGRGDVQIIHGRGGGRVKAAVHRYLRQLRTVAGFRVDPHNPGVTIVTFV